MGKGYKLACSLVAELPVSLRSEKSEGELYTLKKKLLLCLVIPIPQSTIVLIIKKLDI